MRADAREQPGGVWHFACMQREEDDGEEGERAGLVSRAEVDGHRVDERRDAEAHLGGGREEGEQLDGGGKGTMPS